MKWKEGTSKDKQDPWEATPGIREKGDRIEHGKDSAQTEEEQWEQSPQEIDGYW